MASPGKRTNESLDADLVDDEPCEKQVKLSERDIIDGIDESDLYDVLSNPPSPFDRDDDDDEVESGDSSEPCFDVVQISPTLRALRRDTSSISCPIFQKMCEIVLVGDKFTHAIEYLDQHGASAVWRFTSGLIEDNAGLKSVVDQDLWADVTALLDVGQDIADVAESGWYVDVVTSSVDKAYHKKYVGQAKSLRTRHKTHRTKLSDGRTLHHRIASAIGRRPKFLLLGKWTKDASIPNSPALLDIVELYFCLLFQSLPKPTLTKWLPDNMSLRVESGLNIALPLLQACKAEGARKEARMSVRFLAQSTDPEIRSYVGFNVETRAKAQATLAAKNFVTVSQGKRRNGKRAQYVRGPEEGNLQEEHVVVACCKCGHQIVDADPLYRKSDNMYVARTICCTNCPPKSINPKSGAPAYKSKMHNPVDGRSRVYMSRVGTRSTENIDAQIA